MNQTKKDTVLYFEKLSLGALGIFLVIFPLLFLSTTTDSFVLPKQIALSVAVAVFTLFFGLKILTDGKLKLRNSPFDLPIVLFVVVCFLSALFSANRYDALIGFTPLFFVCLLYFAMVNLIRGEKRLLFILSSLVLGAVLAGLVNIFSFFKIYPLPFAYTHVPFFSTFGSLLDQAIYMALVLPISGYFMYATLSSLSSGKQAGSPFQSERGHVFKKSGGSLFTFVFAFIITAVSLAVTVYMLVTTQKPLILPFEIGLQTGLGAISQDSGQVLKSFLLGSGIGTYLVDFTRFKPATYNLNETLWAFTFFRSSSFVLELLATTGILGVVSFLFIVFRVFKEKYFFLPVLLAVVAAFILPFSFTLVALFFILLGIFAVVRIHSNPEKYADTEFHLVALKKGLFAATPDGERLAQNDREKKLSKLLPVGFFILMLLFVGFPVYMTMRFFISDMTFQKSLVAASQNKGLETYNLQIASINIFPYRDVYYRAFSQTNLALANSLALSQKDGKGNAEVQKNIVTLIQQSINAGRNATQLSPFTSFNWNNLSSIYRSIIGFGQNADRFTLLTIQQAIALDPNNPQQYVDLGGVYYQLGQYDESMRYFQVAINLKKDYANAYYNLGHAYEAKGELDKALEIYGAVRGLVQSDQKNVQKIDEEINALKQKIANKDKGQAQKEQPKAEDQANKDEEKDLNVNKPAANLPERNPKVKVPAPTISPLPSKAQTKVSPTAAQKATTTEAPQQ